MIFDFDTWRYYGGDLPAEILVGQGASINMSTDTVVVNGVELGPHEGLIGGVLTSAKTWRGSTATCVCGSEGNDFGYVDTNLYPSSEVYWSPGYDYYEADMDSVGYPHELYYDAHHFVDYVEQYTVGVEAGSGNRGGLSFAFDGADLMVGSVYGETQVRQVDKIEDTAYNDVLTASDAATG